MKILTITRIFISEYLKLKLFEFIFFMFAILVKYFIMSKITKKNKKNFYLKTKEPNINKNNSSF